MVGERQTSILLELSATDNLDGFKTAVEVQGYDVDEASLWYGRRIGSMMMGLEERTPLLIASLYGSFRILNYILKTLKVDANRACGSDGATALHFAAASGMDSSAEVVQLLIDAMADVNALDVNGNRPCDLIPPRLKSSNHLKRKKLEILLKRYHNNNDDDGSVIEEVNEKEKEKPQMVNKEYSIDVPLPDINIGLYSTDEFRMYSFKVKPCSRAYSHDWTECPFVHPGENARRRDPRKYQYTCVPCPEFRKGNCPKNDNCEYAHGVFESWLHPAQYRTRLCKDETGCLRKVCFFAHKHDELRPLYASTGSALPSPKSLSTGPISLDMTPPMSPLGSSSSCTSSPMWANKPNITPPPALQLPGSRLKTALHARDLEMELELELLGLENLRNQNQRQQQQLFDEMSGLSSPYGRMNELKPTNLEGVFGLSSPRLSTSTTPTTQLQMNSLRSSYPAANHSSSPYGFDSSSGGAMAAAAMMNSRSASFAKRSQSFIDRGAVNSMSRPGVSLGFTAAANSAGLFPSKQHNNTEWGSPDGKLEWGFMNKGEDMNKLKKSASFGYRGGMNNNRTTMAPSTVNEPDVSWVHSLVKDASGNEAAAASAGLYNSTKHELIPPWVEQLYIEQEQVSA
ncbi:zinc finger CCCH domain-containing protein 47 [Impatiens glandulifera]|uniref:zinc finger CCCH domain-containing protein 47 n=1 Tax=Impatiens glandulifera TaxID=253017 RepID=UPI001FB1890B|nr:zinc finger CCCH domain-containing protein 47 [Impatiens glandulifera]